MYAHRQTLFDQLPTPAATLAGVGRVHHNQLATSLFHFVCQHLGEHPQACIVRGQRQVSVRVHELEVEVFDRNQGMPLSQRSGELVPVIVALVGDLLMQTRYLPDRFAPALAAFLPSGHPALGHPQPGQRGSQPSWVIDQLAFALRQQGTQAHVDPDWPAFWNLFLLPLGQLQHQADIPFVVDPFDDHMLDDCSLRDRAVVDQLDLADVLQVEAPLSVVLLAQLAAIAVAVLDALEAVIAFEARESWSLSGFEPAEESGEGLVQPAQHLLHAGGIQQAVFLRAMVTLIAEVRPLGGITDALPGFLVSDNALLQSSVVQPTCLGEQVVKGGGLCPVGPQAVLVGPDHLILLLLRFYILLDGFCQHFPVIGDVASGSNINIEQLYYKQIETTREWLSPLPNSPAA